jgi:regulator of sigma E protease
MVPRLKVTALLDEQKDRDKPSDKKLADGDIILAVADVKNPTFKEFREAAIAHEDKELAITVLRREADGSEKTLTISAVPKKGDDERVLIGIAVALDGKHAVVAKTIDVENGPEKLQIPRGATITAVDGVAVSSFYDCIREIRRNAGQRITIDYRLDKTVAGDVAISADDPENSIAVESSFGEVIPFEILERLYKADGPVEAIRMGYRRTIMFIAQAYVTLQRAVTGLVSPKNFMGPIGIIAVSYKIVTERPLIDYVHLLGLISAFIAVFNFLPLLPFDGGHIVFLAAEKLKGAPVSERIQGAVSCVGLGLVAALFLYVTFNDVVRSFIK